MNDPEKQPEEARLHVTALLVASERALNNALDELGFAEDDDRIVEHEARLAFVTCTHETDCDDLFALIAELAARGESWELQFRIDTGKEKAIYQNLARHRPVEAFDIAVSEQTAEPSDDVPAHDLETDGGRAAFKRAVKNVNGGDVFATIAPTRDGRAFARILKRSPRRVLVAAVASDEAKLRGAIREYLPTVMFSVDMKPG